MRTLFFGKLKTSTLESLSDKLSSEMLYPGSSLPVESTDFVILDEGKVGFAYYKKGASMNGEIMETLSVKRSENSVLLTNSMLYMSQKSQYQIVSLDYSVIFKLKFENFLEQIQ